MKNILIAISFLCIALFASCDKTDTLTVVPPKAVVEAYLSPNKVIEVKVTKELPFSDTIATNEALDNLTLKIDVNGVSHTLIHRDSGHYVSDFLVDTGKTYKLSFVYNGKTLEATTTIPTKPTNFTASVSEITITPFVFGSGTRPTFPDPVSLKWTNTTNDYYLVVVQNVDPDPVSISSGRFGNRIFRSRPDKVNTYSIVAPNFQYFGAHSILLYHLNAEYASLYDDNGTNSLNLTAPYSNVSNGLGIFTGISADTIPFYVRKG